MMDQPTDATKGARKSTFSGVIINGRLHQFLVSGMGLLSTFQVYKWQGHGAGDLRQYRGREHSGHDRTLLQSNARTSLAVQTMYKVLEFKGKEGIDSKGRRTPGGYNPTRRGPYSSYPLYTVC